ncbi:CoA ester lyase [Peribacillus sp. ACCC06369]|uniref:HpcH/HpaI aldolase/citrate lyase family protein n=1 Tax=Peribacillus sp. ACCC06369 TaxID=3055860 RepID=UPI0025A1D9EE|nr:CoA ester lyase [Peribacillus sp. ACCC06369]MDM5358873.1 CoA ester lyase [Peribacillus sp. ACCC06369]
MIPRTWMFVPGSDEKKLKKVQQLCADVFIYDLEDAVSPEGKKDARALVRKYIKANQEKENFIRINGFHTPYFYDDLLDLIDSGLTGILLPKAETKEEIMSLDHLLVERESKRNLNKGQIKIVPLIESALGLYNSFEIASASQRVQQLAFGSMDYAFDIKAIITKNAHELLYARSKLVVTSRAAGVGPPIDTVYVDIKDHKGFLAETQLVKELGFQGKLIIHPDQVDLVNQVFAPSLEEIEEAERIVSAFEQALVKGEGVLQLNGKMVDLPIVERAKRTLQSVNLYQS